MPQQYIIAYEIGSSCIKGAAASVDRETGRLEVLAVEKAKLIDKVRHGIVENPADVAACVTAINRRLQQNPALSPRTIRQVYVGISGRSLTSLPADVDRNWGSEMEITRDIITELQARAAQRQIPNHDVVAVTPGTYDIDGKAVTEPVGTFASSIKAHLQLITSRSKMKNNLKRVFNDRCNLKIASWIVTPLAMAQLALTTDERRLGVVLLDCGAETTTLVIYKGGILKRLVTLPMGSRNITLDLTSLNYTEERAEEIKIARGNAVPAATGADGSQLAAIDNTDVNNIVAARADEIISNILQQIYDSGLRPEVLPAGLVITGGGARLRGFVNQLAKHSGMKTRQATVPADIMVRASDVDQSEALDIIAILAEAAMRSVECTELPQQEIKVPEATVDTVESIESRHMREHDDEISRIGTYDDGNDDDLKDDLEPEEAEAARLAQKLREAKKHKTQAPKEQENTGASKKSTWMRLKQRITDMMNDEDLANKQ